MQSHQGSTSDPEVPLKEHLDHFEEHLATRRKSANTLLAHTLDLRLFGEWFALTNGIRECHSHLLLVKHYKPATVNRKLASLTAFCEWAREAGLMPANSVHTISFVEEVRPAPGGWTGTPSTPHKLRHTFSKNLVGAGTPIDRMTSLLGHETVDTTRIYATPSEQDLQRKVQKVAMV